MNGPYDSLVASGSHDETARLWCARSGSCVAIIPAHSDPLSSVRFSQDCTMLLTASIDGICRLWDVHTCSCLRTFEKLSSARIIEANFISNSAHTVVAYSSGLISLHASTTTIIRRFDSIDKVVLFAFATSTNVQTLVTIEASEDDTAVSMYRRCCGLASPVERVKQVCKIEAEASLQTPIFACSTEAGTVLALCKGSICQLWEGYKNVVEERMNQR